MPTLYLRDVPDEVVERLKRRAARDGSSVNAVAVRALAESTRVDNAAILAALPDYDIDTSEIVRAIHEGRAER